MTGQFLKVTLNLDESDIAFFRSIYREAKARAKTQSPEQIVTEVRGLISRLRATPRAPHFVEEAAQTLESLISMLEDKDYAIPKSVGAQVLDALSYFANPEDLIPDHVPGLGFLDDWVVVKIVGQEFKGELAAYAKFVRFRQGAEQRPWTDTARDRLPKRLAAKRAELRGQIEGSRFKRSLLPWR
jgi:uncharacterized membrane protein YkvA (DUF1232 family)